MLECRPAGAKGMGVFTLCGYHAGEELLKFVGPVIQWEDFDEEKHDFDRFVQVGADTFMGPSGGMDDFVNHSCEPNSALLLDPVRLVALVDLIEGEEVTYDYSVTSSELPETWSMRCACGKNCCRGVISGFSSLSKNQQRTYAFLGVVPKYQESAIV